MTTFFLIFILNIRKNWKKTTQQPNNHSPISQNSTFTFSKMTKNPFANIPLTVESKTIPVRIPDERSQNTQPKNKPKKINLDSIFSKKQKQSSLQQENTPCIRFTPLENIKTQKSPPFDFKYDRSSIEPNNTGNTLFKRSDLVYEDWNTEQDDNESILSDEDQSDPTCWSDQSSDGSFITDDDDDDSYQSDLSV